jgi:prophage regulatory protein
MEPKQLSAFMRLTQVIGCRKRGITPIVPVSSSVWWKWVRENKAPQPIRIDGSTFWYRDEINKFVESWRESRANR